MLFERFNLQHVYEYFEIVFFYLIFQFVELAVISLHFSIFPRFNKYYQGFEKHSEVNFLVVEYRVENGVIMLFALILLVNVYVFGQEDILDVALALLAFPDLATVVEVRTLLLLVLFMLAAVEVAVNLLEFHLLHFLLSGLLGKGDVLLEDVVFLLLGVGGVHFQVFVLEMDIRFLVSPFDLLRVVAANVVDDHILLVQSALQNF